MTGVLFRELLTRAERDLGRSLLAAAGLRLPADPEVGLRWFGLWDLTAAEGETLVGAAATCADEPGRVEVLAVVVPAWARRRGLGGRLLREVADRLRAEGTQRVVARAARADRAWPVLLRRAGFTRPDRPQRRDEPGSEGGPAPSVWWTLER